MEINSTEEDQRDALCLQKEMINRLQTNISTFKSDKISRVLPSNLIDENKDLKICSWHLPAGLFWMFNFLLELRIPAFHTPTGMTVAKTILSPYSYKDLEHEVPAIRKIFSTGENYFFQGPIVELTHDYINPEICNMFLLTRDLGVMLVSNLKRNATVPTIEGANILELLNRRDIGPTIFGLTSADSWTFLTSIYIGARSNTISFEKIKNGDIGQLRPLLKYYDVSELDILDAIEATNAITDCP